MLNLRPFTTGIYKKRKSIYHLLVLVIFSDLDIIQFWSVNYMCQVCKLYNLFGTYPKVLAVFNFSVFGEQCGSYF